MARNTVDLTDREKARAGWRAFCEELKSADAIFSITEFPIDRLDLAEGLRYLSRLTRTALERNMEGGDPATPYLYPLCNHSIKVGGDNPDNRYYAASVKRDYVYELCGDIRAFTYFSVVTTGSVDGTNNVTCGTLNGDQIVSDKDGLARIHIGESEVPGNYVPLDEHTRLLIVRCTLESTEVEEPQLQLKRVDMDGAHPASEISAERMINGLKDSANFVSSASGFFSQWTADFQLHRNQLPRYPDQDYLVSTGGDPNIQYYLSAWELSLNETLVVDISEIPPCVTWNLQLCNVWLESLDYTAGIIHVNKSTARYNTDGSVTVVISAADPGKPNWLSTMGHAQGTMCLRLVGSQQQLRVSTRILSMRNSR